jgi:hypothetical protein
VEAYERAQTDALYVRDRWIAEERPPMQESTNGLLGGIRPWPVMLDAEAARGTVPRWTFDMFLLAVPGSETVVPCSWGG